MTTKNSKYEIKQWLNQIYHWMKKTGKTEYTHYELRWQEFKENPNTRGL